MDKEIGKRVISGLMALVLILGCVPMSVGATEAGELCPHHPEHTLDCGGESSCAFQCDMCEQTNVTEEKILSHVIPSEDLPDNDELFEYFLMRELYDYDNSFYGILNRNKLGHVEQGIYDALKPKLEAVAMNGGSTEYCIPTVDGMKTTWTNKELGVSSVKESDVVNLFFQQFDTQRIMDALLGDCPFDLYWFDKTVGMGVGYGLNTKTITSGSQTINAEVTISLYLSFTVAGEYAETEYTVTPAVSRVQTAKNNAAYVVSLNQGKTPYQKMVAYKEYICRAVDYNRGALEPDTPYGNPWQLIYVFDGDSSTNVVCEGYSKAFQYLCDLSGLDCLSVVGTMDGDDHMWNVVTLDGKNYHVDVTNSDTGSVGQNGGLFLVGGSYQNGGYTFPAGGWNWFYACEDFNLAKSNYTPGHVCDSAKKIERVEPTCEEDGCQEHWQCTICGKRYADNECSSEVQASELIIPAAGHDLRSVPEKKATCTDSGNNAYFVCEKCGDAFEDEEGSVSTTVELQTIAASGHKEKTIEGYAATCTEDGLTDGTKCSVCDAVIVKQEIITAPGHKEVPLSGYAATCTVDGLTDGKKCSVCGTVTVEQEAITAPGHAVVIDPAKAATCKEEGLTEGSHCSVCKVTLVYQQTVSKKAHTIVNDAAVEATCTKTGLTAGSHCSVCNEVLVKQGTVPLKAHTEKNVPGYAATCTVDGLTNGTKCSVCDAVIVKQETIEAPGHKEVPLSGYAATCTVNGLSDGKICSVCGTVTEEQKAITAPGHTVVIDPAKAATCKEEGLTEGSHCSVCKVTLVYQQTVSKKAHTIVNDAAVEATCTKTGLTAGSHCSVCNKVLEEQKTVPLKAHTEQIVPGYAASCTVNGLTKGTKCSVCGTVIEKQETIKAPGHKEVTVPGYAKTCTKDGLSDGKKCTVCNTVTVNQKPIPAGHNVVTIPGAAATCTKDGLTDGKKCGDCGAIITAQETIKATGHKVVPKELQKATVDKKGWKAHYECSGCGICFTDSTGKVEAQKASYDIPAVTTVRLSSTRYGYDGKTKTPKVGVYDSQGNKLVKDKDYTVTYAKGRKSVGKYNVTMKGIGNYSFRTTLTFQIVPPKSKISSLSGSSKAFTATWVKKTSQVKGYQLQYSLDKNFETDVKTVTIKDNTVTSKTIKSLSSKKSYYVRIRTYKNVSGQNFYSSWSDAVRVKTK